MLYAYMETPLNGKISPKSVYISVKANEFFYSKSLAAGSLDQLPAPLEHIPADA